jgi:galactose-1-phosphate uridylyltransferase
VVLNQQKKKKKQNFLNLNQVDYLKLDKINKNYNWQFEGTTDYDGTPLEWNFTKSYQLLMYYRVL